MYTFEVRGIYPKPAISNPYTTRQEAEAAATQYKDAFIADGQFKAAGENGDFLLMDDDGRQITIALMAEGE